MGKLRNNGLIQQSEYVGKKLEDAIDYAKKGGYIVRITETDGNTEMVDMLDNRSDRINFRVRNGRVIDVYGG